MPGEDPENYQKPYQRPYPSGGGTVYPALYLSDGSQVWQINLFKVWDSRKTAPPLFPEDLAGFLDELYDEENQTLFLAPDCVAAIALGLIIECRYTWEFDLRAFKSVAKLDGDVDHVPKVSKEQYDAYRQTVIEQQQLSEALLKRRHLHSSESFFWRDDNSAFRRALKTIHINDDGITVTFNSKKLPPPALEQFFLLLHASGLIPHENTSFVFQFNGAIHQVSLDKINYLGRGHLSLKVPLFSNDIEVTNSTVQLRFSTQAVAIRKGNTYAQPEISPQQREHFIVAVLLQYGLVENPARTIICDQTYQDKINELAKRFINLRGLQNHLAKPPSFKGQPLRFAKRHTLWHMQRDLASAASNKARSEKLVPYSRLFHPRADGKGHKRSTSEKYVDGFREGIEHAERARWGGLRRVKR